MSNDRLIIIGSGLAGYNLAKELRRLQSKRPIDIFTLDDGSFYSKPMLSNALAKQKTPGDLPMQTAAQFALQFNVTIHPHTPIKHIDTTQKTAYTQKHAFEYQDLVFAVGAKARSLDQVCSEVKAPTFTVNCLSDYVLFRQHLDKLQAQKAVKVLLVGGGLIGCEFANDLAQAGAKVSVVDIQNRCMANQLPPVLSHTLQQALESLGVEFHWSTALHQVIEQHKAEQTYITATTKTGHTLGPVDLVLCAIGLEPHITLAKECGLVVTRGIKVDQTLQGSQDHIYALGDCACVNGLMYQFVLPLMACVRALAKTLNGSTTPVSYPPMPIVVKTPICPLVITPPAPNVNGGHWEYEKPKQEDQSIDQKALFKDASGTLQGFALMGRYTIEKNQLIKQLPPLL